MPSDLDGARYISFVSYKRDGTPVATPTWVTPFDGGYAFTTDESSFKVKRIKLNPEVTITSSNVRGTVKRGFPEHRGTAEILGETASTEVAALIKHKYRYSRTVLIVPFELLNKVRGKDPGRSVGVKVTLSN
jgi:PPOX class probable F420-dependent enzyme